jgi:hypothetical protein
LDQLAESIDTREKDQDTESLQPPEEVTNGSSQQPNNQLIESLEQSLERRPDSSSSLISEPANIVVSEQVVSTPLTEHTEPLTGQALARRLNVSATTISRRKSKPDFPEWSQSKDPAGIAWTYAKKSKLFVAKSPIGQLDLSLN